MKTNSLQVHQFSNPLRKASILFAFRLAGLAVLNAHSQSTMNLTIRETEGVERQGEVVGNGIPIAKIMNLKSIGSLQVTDNSGKQIPAQFEVLSRWGGPLQSDSAIQWLLVNFPVDVKAGDKKTFTLSAGSNIAPIKPISVSNTATDVTISTGVAKFVLDKTVFSILKSASILDTSGKETPLIGSSTNGSSTINVQEVGDMVANAPEEVAIEHQGPICVTVKMAGHYSSSVAGGKSLCYVARFTFYAGSPTMELDFHFFWPGSTSGSAAETLAPIGIVTEEQIAKSLLLNKVKINVPLALTGPFVGFAKSEKSKAPFTGNLASEETVSISQYRRNSQMSNPRYRVKMAAQSDSGRFADMPFVMVNGATGGVGATIQKMKFYEPQAIVAGSKSLEIDLVAEPQYVTPFSGGFGKIGISLITSDADLTQFQSRVLASIDHKLIAWPSVGDVSNSKALGELWDGKPNFVATSYLNNLEAISNTTLNTFIDSGMYGFMTYGLPARYMSYGPEGGDNTTWDGFFWNGSFTDYHNAMSNATMLFALSGETELLYNLSFPAARRTLRTQIVQSDPKDSAYFSGWAPTGYGGFRKDANSSHSYFENLYLYYYLTGDREVIEILQKAGNTLRKSYTRDSNGKLLPATNPCPVPWNTAEGRMNSQHLSIFWFLSHASTDFSFSDDYRNQCERLVNRNLILAKKDTQEYAFLSGTEITDTNTSTATEQNWMLGMYPMNDLWRIYTEYGDVSLGKDNVKISRIFASTERTIWEFTAKVGAGADGTVNGNWANSLDVTWSGIKIGGKIGSVTLHPAQEPNLFPSGKGLLTTLSFRAFALNPKETDFEKHGFELFNSAFSGYNPRKNLCWDKEQAEFFTRIHPAIKYMSDNLADGIKSIPWNSKKVIPLPRVRPYSGSIQFFNLEPGSEISISNMLGKEVWRKDFFRGAQSYNLNLRAQPGFSRTALYFYRIINSNRENIENGKFLNNPIN